MGNEPKKISHQEYWAIRKALYKKAVELNKLAGRGESPQYWFAGSSFPCGLPYIPGGFRWSVCHNARILHFISWACTCKKRAANYESEDTICIATVKKKYYLTTHLIGKCPWKMAL